MVIDEFYRVANQIECVFWNVIGLGFLVSAVRPNYRRLKLLAWPVLAAFGLSDFAESGTGAWWEPWWLLVWKAVCFVSMAALFFLYMKSQRKAQAKNAQAPPPSPDQ